MGEEHPDASPQLIAEERVAMRARRGRPVGRPEIVDELTTRPVARRQREVLAPVGAGPSGMRQHERDGDEGALAMTGSVRAGSAKHRGFLPTAAMYREPGYSVFKYSISAIRSTSVSTSVNS